VALGTVKMNFKSRHLVMWAEACSVVQRADGIRNEFFRPIGSDGGQPQWEPPIDIVMNEDTFSVVVALPGVDPDEIEINIEGETLRVSGVRPIFPATRSGSIRRLEIPYGQFERRIQFSVRRLKVVQRQFENGCLMLDLKFER